MESHLLQMRGLKLPRPICVCGAMVVASFTDAWIETTRFPFARFGRRSHLLQMRGLKPKHGLVLRTWIGRIFYRCVD